MTYQTFKTLYEFARLLVFKIYLIFMNCIIIYQRFLLQILILTFLPLFLGHGKKFVDKEAFYMATIPLIIKVESKFAKEFD